MLIVSACEWEESLFWESFSSRCEVGLEKGSEEGIRGQSVIKSELTV